MDLATIMKQTPYGHPMMDAAFLAFCVWLIGKPETKTQFKNDTGYDLETLMGLTPLDKLINDATGKTADVIGAYFDWVAVNHWGLEGDIDTPLGQ